MQYLECGAFKWSDDDDDDNDDDDGDDNDDDDDDDDALEPLMISMLG